jgi:hypothetical protein
VHEFLQVDVAISVKVQDRKKSLTYDARELGVLQRELGKIYDTVRIEILLTPLALLSDH